MASTPISPNPAARQGGDRRGGVGELVTSVEPGLRQVEQVELVLVDDPPTLGMDGEILVADPDRRGADLFGEAAEDRIASL